MRFCMRKGAKKTGSLGSARWSARAPWGGSAAPTWGKQGVNGQLRRILSNSLGAGTPRIPLDRHCLLIFVRKMQPQGP